MNRRNRFNIGSGLIVTALALSWPGGRPSYITLETFAGLSIVWWFWPALCVLLACLIFLLRPGRALVVALIAAAALYQVFALAVGLSVGPGVLLGAAWTATLGSMRVALDLKADLHARREAAQRRVACP